MLVLLAAGCGSDSKSDDVTTAPAATDAAPDATTATPDATTATPDATTGGPAETAAPAATVGETVPVADIVAGQGVSDTEISIGFVLDDSGPFAAFSPTIRAAINARFSLVNDSGGIAGRQLKAIYYDSKSDPATALINTKRLWEQDKVLLIFSGDLVGAPLDYAVEKDIPLVAYSGGVATFSSKYPNVVPVGGNVPAWNAQSAYAVVNYQDKHPKHVAVSIYPYEEPLKFWIEDYWKKLGAETVSIDIGVDPTADCSALVLKNQSDDIDFWDFHDNSWLACIPAELNAGWSPEFGQGGPSTSEIATASLIGKPMADLQVLAGAPTTLANGLPVYSTTPPANQEYIDAMKKYAPEFSTDRWLNDPVQVPLWISTTLITDAITAVAASGEISPEALNKWFLETKNWPAPTTDPIRGLAGDCKTGSDATIWGTWQWDDAKSELYMVPFAPHEGEKLINNDWLDPDPCYLTKLADKYYT